MSNLKKKEKNLNNLIDKLGSLNTSYSQSSYDKEKQEERKQIEFSEKIDELNQETDTLLEEIDKWEM